MIKFDDLHKSISKKIYVPVIGDIMATRWAYEALCVEEFKSNKFEKPFFKYDMDISQNEWYASFLIPALKVKIGECLTAGKDPVYKEYTENNFIKLNFHINDLSALSGIKPGAWIKNVNSREYNDYVADEARLFLDSLKTVFRLKGRAVTNKRDSLYKQISGNLGAVRFAEMRSKDYNENLANFVLNRLTISKIYDSEKRLVQKADPVFMRPGSKTGRAHFFAPYKQIGNLKVGTLLFNLLAIWIMIMFLFATLYYNLLKRFIASLESLKLPILRKFGRDLLQF
jgi:ABC transport system ATP-binding/permease protein